jgi:hypothetical protein
MEYMTTIAPFETVWKKIRSGDLNPPCDAPHGI